MNWSTFFTVNVLGQYVLSLGADPTSNLVDSQTKAYLIKETSEDYSEFDDAGWVGECTQRRIRGSKAAISSDGATDFDARAAAPSAGPATSDAAPARLATTLRPPEPLYRWLGCRRCIPSARVSHG